MPVPPPPQTSDAFSSSNRGSAPIAPLAPGQIPSTEIPSFDAASRCRTQRVTNLSYCKDLSPAANLECVRQTQYQFAVCNNQPFTGNIRDSVRISDARKELNLTAEARGEPKLPIAPDRPAGQARPAGMMPARNPDRMKQQQHDKACAVAGSQLARITKNCNNIKRLCTDIRYMNLASCQNGSSVAACEAKVDAAQTKAANLKC